MGEKRCVAAAAREVFSENKGPCDGIIGYDDEMSEERRRWVHFIETIE